MKNKIVVGLILAWGIMGCSHRTMPQMFTHQEVLEKGPAEHWKGSSALMTLVATITPHLTKLGENKVSLRSNHFSGDNIYSVNGTVGDFKVYIQMDAQANGTYVTVFGRVENIFLNFRLDGGDGFIMEGRGLVGEDSVEVVSVYRGSSIELSGSIGDKTIALQAYTSPSSGFSEVKGNVGEDTLRLNLNYELGNYDLWGKVTNPF